jgi:hypothetical protein
MYSISRSPRIAIAFLALAALVFAGCGPPSKHEILSKAEGLETKAELEAAIGPPSDVDKVGPIARWTYVASDGEVEFVITGDNVSLGSTKDSKAEE